MSRSWIVARKELLDTVRDSRTLLLTFVLPFTLYPVIFIVLGQVVTANQQRREAAILRVAVSGADHAPGLTALLAKEAGLAFLPVEFGQEAIRDRLVEAVVVVPPGHESAVMAGIPSTIQIYFDETDGLSRRTRDQVAGVLEEYRKQILGDQIGRLGGERKILEAPQVDEENVASPQEMGAYVLGSLVPYLLVLLIASAASHTAIDTTAGEKERSTLETILVSAASRRDLIFGKFVATFATAAAAGVMGLAGLVLALAAPVTAQALADGQGISLPAWSIGVLLLMILPVAMLLSSALLVFGCFARSAREGQTFATYFILCVAILAVMSVMSDVEPKTEMLMIPIVGTTQVQRQILNGAAAPADVLIAIASTLFVGTLGLAVAMRLFANERVMFRQ